MNVMFFSNKDNGSFNTTLYLADVTYYHLTNSFGPCHMASKDTILLCYLQFHSLHAWVNVSLKKDPWPHSRSHTLKYFARYREEDLVLLGNRERSFSLWVCPLSCSWLLLQCYSCKTAAGVCAVRHVTRLRFSGSSLEPWSCVPVCLSWAGNTSL